MDKLLHFYIWMGHTIYPSNYYINEYSIIKEIRIKIAHFFYTRAYNIDNSIFGDD